MNAGKFLAGYVSGLPIERFDTGGFSNVPQFYQLRPTAGKTEDEDKRMFASRKFSQVDIARCAITCVAGPVAECMKYGEASGTSPADVQLLNELLNAVVPPLKPEAAQNYIRWAVLSAYDILSRHKGEYQKLTEAFARGASLEDCIAAIEG
eukprot:gene2107-2512_t